MDDATGSRPAGGIRGFQHQLGPVYQDRRNGWELYSHTSTHDRLTGNLRREGRRNAELAGMTFTWSPGGMNGDSITLHPYPVIEGSVVDAASGEAIPIFFKLVPGWDTGSGFTPAFF